VLSKILITESLQPCSFLLQAKHQWRKLAAAARFSCIQVQVARRITRWRFSPDFRPRDVRPMSKHERGHRKAQHHSQLDTVGIVRLCRIAFILTSSILVFYQVFDKKCNPLLIKQPPDPNNPYVGRIGVDTIPPPHTAASIKRCISRAEGLGFSNQSQIFPFVSSPNPIDQGHIPILTSECPGSTSDQPIAIVNTSSISSPLRIDTPMPLPRRGGGVAPSPCRSLMRPSP
jgi:hypothetical protein